MDFVDVTNESSALGITPAALEILLNAVPVPADIADFGLRQTGDSSAIVGVTVSRTVQLAFGPLVTATAVLVLKADGQIERVVMGALGLDYIRPPIMTVDPGAGLTGINAMLRAFLNVAEVVVDSGGAAYPAPPATTVAFLGGLPPADTQIVSGCVRRIAMLKDKQGLGYAPGTVVSIDGGGLNGASPIRQAKATCTVDAFGRITDIVLTDMGAGYIQTPAVNFVPPGGVPPTKLAKASVAMAEGTPATAHVTVLAGAVTAVIMDTPGSGYVAVPTPVITGAPGVGATATARMQVERVDVRNQGIGYTATAVPVFTPFFKSAFPDASNQARPFFGFMEWLLENRVITPIRSLPPVLS